VSSLDLPHVLPQMLHTYPQCANHRCPQLARAGGEPNRACRWVLRRGRRLHRFVDPGSTQALRPYQGNPIETSIGERQEAHLTGGRH